MPAITAKATSATLSADATEYGQIIPVTCDPYGRIRTVIASAETIVVTGSISTIGTTTVTGTTTAAVYNATLSAYRPLRADGTTHSLQIIDYEHHELHGGSSFTFDLDTSLAAGASAIIIVETPNTTSWAHFVYDIESQYETRFRIYEAASYAASGTRIIPQNRDRNSSKTSGVWVHHTPTTPSIAGALLLRTRHWGSGKAVGGTNRGLQEFILKQGTKYALYMINESVSTGWIDGTFDYYEHTNAT